MGQAAFAHIIENVGSVKANLAALTKKRAQGLNWGSRVGNTRGQHIFYSQEKRGGILIYYISIF